jgi:hypothetical protein
MISIRLAHPRLNNFCWKDGRRTQPFGKSESVIRGFDGLPDSLHEIGNALEQERIELPSSTFNRDALPVELPAQKCVLIPEKTRDAKTRIQDLRIMLRIKIA